MTFCLNLKSIYKLSQIAQCESDNKIETTHLGAIVIEALRCSLIAGAKRFVLWKSESNVFWRSPIPHERFMRSDTSVLTMSDDDDVNLDGNSTDIFSLQFETNIEKKKT